MPKYLLGIAVFLAVAFLCFPLYAQEEEAARFRYSLWGSEIAAKLKIDSGTTYGTEFDLNDLGMDKKDTIEVWELEMWEGQLKLDISYWENRWDGYAQITRDIVFEGFNYDIADIVDSSFRMRTTDVSLTTRLVSNYKSSFGLVGGLKYIEYYAKLWSVTGGLAADEEVVAPIPYAGVSVDFLLAEQTILGGRFVLFQYAYSGTHVDVGNFYQIDAFVEFRAGTSLALRIGFHNMSISYRNRTLGDEFEITQTMKGSYAAIYISF